jgi:hypothetical protein
MSGAEELDAFIGQVEPKWRAFLKSLVDAQRPRDASRWGSEDEAWRDIYYHLDRVAAAYAALQVDGKVINEFGPVDDQRLAELIEPYLRDEADRSVFVAVCKQMTRQVDFLIKAARRGGVSE